MTQKKFITREKFGQWRKEIAAELVLAYIHYHIWKQLLPSTRQIARTINQYKNFFRPTSQAHFNQFLMCVMKITDKRRDSKSMWRLLDEAEKDPSLVSQRPISVADLRARIEAHDNVLGKIRTHRNKRLAHIDESHSWPDSIIWSENPITVGESERLLTDLEDVFKKLSLAHDRVMWPLRLLVLDDTSRLLEKLYKKVVAPRVGLEPTT